MSLDDVNVNNAARNIPTPVQSMKSGSAGKDSIESDMTELFKLNQVLYRLPPTLSLVTKRCYLKQQFQQQSYSNCAFQTLQCVFNTGEYYISPRSSFMVITVGYMPKVAPIGTQPTYAPDANIYAYLGQGNVTSLFEEVTLTSASGTEICREQNKGLLNTHVLRNTLQKGYIETAGQAQGFSDGSIFNTFSGRGQSTPTNEATFVTGGTPPSVVGNPFPISIAEINSNGPQTFIIPLSQVMGCFNPAGSTLFPPGALAGSNFLLRFKNPEESLIWSGPGLANYPIPDTGLVTPNTNLNFITGFSVTDIYFMLDAFQMNDSVLKRLNQVAAGQDGLSVLFDTWDYTLKSGVQTGAVEAQVQQARSRISQSFCVVRDQAIITNPYGNSLASESLVANINGSNYGTNMLVANGTGENKQVYWNPYYVEGLGDDNKHNFMVPPDPQTEIYVRPQYSTNTTKVSTYQAQLGSLFFPQQPLGPNYLDYILNANFVWRKGMSDGNEYNSLNMMELIGADGTVYNVEAKGFAPRDPVTSTTGATLAGDFIPFQLNYGGMTFGMLAERSQLLQLSGLPISNARLLRHKFTFMAGTPSNGSRQIDVFTEYTRVMKVFLGGRIVLRE